jgi:predicted RNase H-like nuclease (RuvC/YqgF family)
MTDKVRQVSERSLENLKLGAQSRYQGKQRHNFTVLPETVQWLKGTGNASDAIDVLVEAAKDKGLFSNNTHDREVQLVFNDAYQQNVKELQVSLEETQLELSKLRSQLVEAQKENNFQEARWKLAESMNDEAIDENRKLKQLNQELEADLEKLKLSEPVTTNQLSDNHSEILKATEILKAALNIPSNTGGKIKTQIKEVLKLIDGI